MKKITLFLFLLLFGSGVINAIDNESVPEYIINESFDGLSTYPTGWSAGTAIYGASAGLTVANNLLTVSATNGGGNRGFTINTPSSGSEQIVYIDFDWVITSATVTNRNALGLFMHDAAGLDILNLYCSGNDGKIHYQNIDNTTVAFNAGGSFNKAAADYPACNTLNASTITTCDWAAGQTINIKATLNFTTKQITYIKLTSSNSTSYESSDARAFLNSSAANLAKVSLFNSRSNNTGTNGNTVNFSVSLNNYKVYKMVEVAVFADVTINYLDQNGDVAKTARVESGKPIGVPYAATTDDKLSFTADGYYYAFDAANTLADHVIVAEGGSTINLKFKKTPLTTGTYTWTGTTNGNWNETDENFSTDGVNALGFQNSNAVAFTASGANKSINLSGILNIGEENITLEGDGYSFSGSGSLNGTGAFILNSVAEQTTSLNITNSLTGGVVINGGTATILKDAAATRLTLANGASVNLSTGAAFSKAISGTGTISLIPTSNVTYSSAITGAEQVNYSLVSAGAVTAGGVFSAMPILNNTFSGSINVSTTLSETAMFGSTNSFADNKLTLGNNVGLVYPINPASDGTTTVAIGELTGSASSKIMGPRLRNVNYNVGSLGTNSVFEGTIQNFAADQWSNIPVINFAKSGAGELTMSGESTQYIAGAIAVNAGSLKVTGILGSATVPVTVANGATLKGTGTIGGATTINGTLMGNLNFGSNLTLTNNVELTITGFTEGEYDVIDVAGTLTNGGTLKVTSSATAPANNTSIQLLKAGTYSGQFSVKNLPEHYSFDEATGYLTYNNLLSALEQNNNLRIYPALTRGEIFVTGAEVLMVEVCNMTGNVLHKTNGNTTSNVINISNLSSGAYILRVTLANGETKIHKVLLNK